ncbi:MAG: DUF1295 domain-containing protein [Bacteroidetes bacterium]|nr:DUF1295 domain-containing protein [Bacteroidota bacterium]MDA1119470.1 DUF1295 domain-containing protein [Bacteroidota bacterium]
MKTQRPGRITSLLIVLIAYVVAIATGIYIGILLDFENTLISAAVGDIAATIVIFAFSFFLKNSSLYDPYWSIIPILIATYWMINSPEGNMVRHSMIIFLIVFWGLRLTINWIRGWKGLHHQDWRYTDLARKNGKVYWLISFSGIHMFPTMLVFAGMSPVWVAMKSASGIGLMDYIAFLITFSAIVIEWISDEQLIAFKHKNLDKQAFIKTGLWAYSRHPNYFGEVAFWVGLFLFAFGISNTNYWTGNGAVAMIILFVFISIPMMDDRHKASRPEYEAHVKKVSALVPWFRES